MKKPMTLAEQVKDAQRVLSSWSTQKRESVRLEGGGIHQNRELGARRCGSDAMTAARIAAVERVRSALSVARDLAGVPGHYSDALHDLVSARAACTQWFGDEENALRREADAYLDANAWQREVERLRRSIERRLRYLPAAQRGTRNGA